MKKIIMLFLTMMLVAACSSTQNSQPTAQPTTGYAAKDSGNVKEFTMTAKNWEFDPGTITVNKGDTVLLHIASTDVEHGFFLPDFNVNKKINPGETVDVQFVADKTGTFTFHCNVFCGAGHREMEGQLIVQ